MSFSEWVASSTPSSTTLTSIATTHVSGLQESLKSASGVAATATVKASLYSASQVIRGAQASLTVISNQNYLATATATQDFPQATQAIFNATLNLKDLEWSKNLYDMHLSMAANWIFTACFIAVFVFHCGLMAWSRFWYFGIAFFCGSGLELAGYLSRALSVHDWTNDDKFFCQIISLTIAPAFIMGGIYYLLAQFLILYGRQYSILKPMWFSYIFIFCDVASLVIQAVGGAMAATSLENYEDTDPGTHVMVAGIAFQVFSMSFFLILLFHFLFKIYFCAHPNIKFSFSNLFHLFMNTGKGAHLHRQLDPYYNPNYRDIRSRKLIHYGPLILLAGVIFIYIRCIYRVVELAQGWTGYLITHESFVMTLDALMVFFTCAIFVPFHPVILFGRHNSLSLKVIKKNLDLEANPEHNDGKSSQDSFSRDASDNNLSETFYDTKQRPSSDVLGARDEKDASQFGVFYDVNRNEKVAASDTVAPASSTDTSFEPHHTKSPGNGEVTASANPATGPQIASPPVNEAFTNDVGPASGEIDQIPDPNLSKDGDTPNSSIEHTTGEPVVADSNPNTNYIQPNHDESR